MANPDVLFLCSMNYYRSRFAELYFNHLAKKSGVALRAESRGLMTDAYDLPGMSVHAQEILRRMKIEIEPEQAARDPQLVTPADLESAGRVVAVYRREHEPMVLRRFPKQKDLVEYWHIRDLDESHAIHALANCRDQVEALFAMLKLEKEQNSTVQA